MTIQSIEICYFLHQVLIRLIIWNFSEVLILLAVYSLLEARCKWYSSIFSNTKFSSMIHPFSGLSFEFLSFFISAEYCINES